MRWWCNNVLLFSISWDPWELVLLCLVVDSLCGVPDDIINVPGYLLLDEPSSFINILLDEKSD